MQNAEQSLLACILKKGDLIKEVALEPYHFEKLEHQILFTAMKEIDTQNDPIDIVSVNIHLGQDLQLYGGSQYLSNLINSIATTENFKTYEKYILNTYKIRKSKELLTKIQTVQKPNELNELVHVMDEVTTLLEQGQEKSFDMVETLVDLTEELESKTDGYNGVPTGFTELDNILDGLSDEELIILAARPSVGKTAFALGVTKNVCEQNHFVDFFSLEMSGKSLLTRMICSIGNINSMKIKNITRRFNEEDKKKYQHAITTLNKFKNNLTIYDESKVTVQDIRSKVKASIRKQPDKKHVVIIDYLTLITGSGRKERHLEIGEITRGLKRMARDLKVPVVLLSQLSRSVEQRSDKRPMLSDLRDSGEIEQDADKILFLHRDDYYDKETENKNIIDIIVSKNRNGALGVVNLAFVREYQSFVNLERRYEG